MTMTLTQVTTGGVDENINIDSNTLKVDGTNNRVGIGTASPASKFTVADNGYTPIEIQSDRTTATDNIGGVHFKSATTNVAYIQSLVNGTIKFRNTSSLTERMRIDSSGNVGIGTASPSSLLHLESASSPKLLLVDTTNSCTLKAYAQNSNAHLGTESNHDFIFDTNNTERMRIDSSGNVGIGTTNAVELINGVGGGLKLSRNSSGSPSSGQSLMSIGFHGVDDTNSNNAAEAKIESFATAHHSGTTAPADMRFYTKPAGTGPGSSPTERMRIDSSGNIGVGGNPTVFTGQNFISVHSPGSSTNIAGLDFYVSGTRESGLISYPSNSESLRIFGNTARAITLHNNGAERMRIDSSGRMMVGMTSTPSSASLATLTGGNSSSYAYMFIAGGSTTSYKMLKAGGKFLVRNISERNIDLVQAVQASGNMNILITVKFKLNSAVTGHSGEILCQADMHATGSGNWSYGTKTPQVTMHFGSGYGAGSLSWVGGGTNTKILRYATDSNVNYTNYMIEEIVITGYDNANATLL